MKAGTKARRPRNAGATRETLLAAAAGAFAENGFAGARVDRIARSAGVNKAMIYAYFGDKEGLYRAVLSSRLAAPVLSLARAAERDAFRSLEDVVEQYLRVLIEDRAFARLLSWDLLSPDRERRAALADSLRPALDLIDNMVRRAQESGSLPPGVAPALFRVAVIALGLGFSIQRAALEADQVRTGAGLGDREFIGYARRLLLERGGEAGCTRRRRAQ
jgi:TetR/AcrR family transcriptional regulator